MKTNAIYSCIYGGIAGTVVCLIGIIRSWVPYLVISSNFSAFLIIITSASGVAVAIVAMLFRHSSLVAMIIRYFVFFLSIGGCYILGAYLQIWTTLLQLLYTKADTVADNVSGLLFITYLLVVGVATTATIVFRGVVTMIKNISSGEI